MLATPLDKEFTMRKLEIDPITCDFQVRLNRLKSSHVYSDNPFQFMYKDFEYPILEQLERFMLTKFKIGTRGKEYTLSGPEIAEDFNDKIYIEYPLINLFDKTNNEMLFFGTLTYLMMRPQSCATALWTVAYVDSPYFANHKFAYRNAKTLFPMRQAFQELQKQIAMPTKFTAAGDYIWVPFLYTVALPKSILMLRAVTLELQYMLKYIPDLKYRDQLKLHIDKTDVDVEALSDDPSERLVQICKEIHKAPETVKLPTSPRTFELILALARWIANILRVKQATLLNKNVFDIVPEDRRYKPIVNPFTDVLESILSSEAALEDEEDEAKAESGFTTHSDKLIFGKPLEGGGRGTIFIDDSGKRTYGRYQICVNKALKSTTEGLAIYAKEMAKYSTVLSQFERKLKEIRTYNTGGKMPGLDHGKLDRKNMYRYKVTDKIFYNNTYEHREQDLAIGVLLDESGSMCGDGIKNGRAALILMHEVLTNMHINHCIAGHTSSGSMHDVEINPYVWFRENKNYVPQKCTALATIKAKRGNCDSGALYFMEQELLKTKNRDRLCLVFSDGAPTECTGDELIEQVKTMEKHGIKVIGIGVNFPNIAKYYEDNANGSNLVEMLEIVCNILQRYILQKKT